MQYYMIAAGGTGAMCVQSFIYMAAAGCAQKDAQYHILLVDKDKESDAKTACENLLENYNALRKQMVAVPHSFVMPEINLHSWNFTEEIIDEYCCQGKLQQKKKKNRMAEDLKDLTLKNLLNPDDDSDTALLLRSLYSDEELNTDLNKGFYGHPNIGAAVFDYIQERFLLPTFKNAQGVPVTNTFMSQLHASLQAGYAHVYLMGSLFGGTGATIIPNVAAALRTMRNPDNSSENYGRSRLILGGAVVMPYFRLPLCPDDSIEAIECLRPSDTKFAEQTREALRAYDESELLGKMMNLTLVGTSTPDVTSEIYSRGGEQHQHFHMVLTVAAAAANRFFANTLGNMRNAIPDDGKNLLPPLGELLVWKFTPADPQNKGTYHTLDFAELGLQDEYTHMTSFLCFSVIVAYFMRLRYEKTEDELKEEVEILGTIHQMKRDNPNARLITDSEIQKFYKEPVSQAGAICRGFIQYYFDLALSGYDWTHYYNYVQDKTKTNEHNGKTYYQYKRDGIAANAPSYFNERWVDIANLEKLKMVLEANLPQQVISNTVLNEILSYDMLDEEAGRAGKSEVRFPNSISTYYYDALENLGLIKVGWRSKKMKRTDVHFSQIYDELYRICQ